MAPFLARSQFLKHPLDHWRLRRFEPAKIKAIRHRSPRDFIQDSHRFTRQNQFGGRQILPQMPY